LATDHIPIHIDLLDRAEAQLLDARQDALLVTDDDPELFVSHDPGRVRVREPMACRWGAAGCGPASMFGKPGILLPSRGRAVPVPDDQVSRTPVCGVPGRPVNPRVCVGESVR
jgi:hypothetical protein